MSDTELRSSLLSIGPILPIYTWNGMLIDGGRRSQMGARLGLAIPSVALDTRQDAARTLWALHPDRCLTVFHCTSLSEAAELYGATPARVAAVRAGAFPREPEPAPPGRGWRARHQVDRSAERENCKKVQFWIPNDIREQMFRARKALGGTSEAAFIRRAIVAAIERVELDLDARHERLVNEERPLDD